MICASTIDSPFVVPKEEYQIVYYSRIDDCKHEDPFIAVRFPHFLYTKLLEDRIKEWLLERSTLWFFVIKPQRLETLKVFLFKIWTSSILNAQYSVSCCLILRPDQRREKPPRQSQWARSFLGSHRQTIHGHIGRIEENNVGDDRSTVRSQMTV